MNLATFLSNLRFGELKDLYLGEPGDVLGYSDENRERFLSYINQGLTALHSRFELLKKEMYVEMWESVSIYYLRPEHSMSSGTDSRKYINDLGSTPFTGGFIKVIEIYDADGCEVPLNEEGCDSSVFTTTFDSLQVPYPESSSVLSVIYQADHDRVVDSNFENQRINLPPFLIEALGSFVSGKAHTWIGGDGPTAKGAEYMARFNEICTEAEMKDLTQTSVVREHSKLEQRGFV